MLGKSKRDRVLRWFLHHPLSAGTHDFEPLARMAAAENLTISGLDAETYVNRNVRQLWKHLAEHERNSYKRGLTPIVKIVDYESRKVAATVRYLHHLTPDRRARVVERLSCKPHVLRKIDSLNDREYEGLGVLACKAIGAQYTRLTPKTKEGGIDFLAIVQSRGGFPPSSRLQTIRIVGQAKMYSDPVSLSEVREFSDTMEDVRRQSPTVTDQLPSWFVASNAPIVGWLVGHSGFQSGSESKARMNSIVLHDTLSIADIIVFSRSENTAISGGSHAGYRLKQTCQEILKYGG